ncbi:MAG: T9SS type A sorting domain-containing protein [Flavobacterium sp.]|nr:T9SS type A sorting domain-containing protein [Flavobacterium sp.]
MKISPNPTSDKIKILIKDKIKTFGIYTVTGVFIETELSDGYIDVSNLKKGIYIVKVNQYYIKFIKI